MGATGRFGILEAAPAGAGGQWERKPGVEQRGRTGAQRRFRRVPVGRAGGSAPVHDGALRVAPDHRIGQRLEDLGDQGRGAISSR
jgi:hypothetical protein